MNESVMVRALGASPDEVLAHLAKNAPEAFHRAVMCSRNAAMDKKRSDDSFIREIHGRGGNIPAVRVCMKLREMGLKESKAYVEQLVGCEVPLTCEVPLLILE